MIVSLEKITNMFYTTNMLQQDMLPADIIGIFEVDRRILCLR